MSKQQSIDPMMEAAIKEINNSGYPTIFSCSGTEADHPDREDMDMLSGYISFPLRKLSLSQIDKIKSAAAAADLCYEEILNSINPMVKVYYPVIGNDGTRDIHKEVIIRSKELHDLGEVVMESCPDGSMQIKRSIIEEVKEMHGGVLHISDEYKMSVWNRFIDALKGR